MSKAANGVYISGPEGYFVSNTVLTGVAGTPSRTGIYKSKNAYTITDGAIENNAALDDSPAALYYFEDMELIDSNSFTCYIYCYSPNGEKQYVHGGNNNSLGFGEKPHF